MKCSLVRLSSRIVAQVALSCLVLATSMAAAATWDQARLAQLAPALKAFVDSGEIAGAVGVIGDSRGVQTLVTVGDRDIEAKSPLTRDTLFRIASMTKPVTAIGIMILVDEGKLSPDDAVGKYIPAFADKRFPGSDKPILIRHLLTHTSGMPGGLPKELGDLYIKRDRTLAEGVEGFVKQAVTAEPGTLWTYNNLGIDTLGRIIEIVAGQPYEEFLQKRVFNPLGMNDTCFRPSDEQLKRRAVTYGQKDGKLVSTMNQVVGEPAAIKYPIPAGGLYSTGPDLARLYQMMLNRGKLGDVRILSEKAVATMTSLQTGEIKTGFVDGMGFGFGWAYVREPRGATEDLSVGTFGHGGAFGTQGWIDPKKDLFVILLIQRTGLNNGDNSTMRRAIQKVAAEARGQ